MNLELYRIFLVVAEAGNITKASNQLHISQPAVTKHIKNLEEELGNPLFIRTKRGVILNEYGKILFMKVKQALTLLSEAEKEVNHYKDSNKGTIKIGISTTLAHHLLLPFLEEFHQQYPNIVIDIYTDPTKELITKLKNGRLDFIIGKFPLDKDLDLEYKKLGTTKYIFVYNPNYYQLPKEISCIDLKHYPILLQKSPSNARKSVDKYFKENHIILEPKMNIASSNLLISFIKIGYGIGFVTKLYVKNELKNNTLKEVKLEPDTDKIDYGIIYLKHNIFPSYCQNLIDFIIRKTHNL